MQHEFSKRLISLLVKFNMCSLAIVIMTMIICQSDSVQIYCCY